MKKALTMAVLACVLAGCGGDAGDASSDADTSPSPSVAPTSAAPTPDPAAAAAEAGAKDAITAIRLCTEGLAEPDGKVLDAVRAAREGTRSDAEIAVAFQSSQDAVEALVAQVPARYPRLAAALQEYADTLGRARVQGGIGVPEITAAVDARNAVCDSPA